MGKVQRTIFLCRYLQFEALRREIQEGLNVVENWNSATNFIHYGRYGEFATNQREDQELAMLALHLLQISLVYVLSRDLVLRKTAHSVHTHREQGRHCTLNNVTYCHVFNPEQFLPEHCFPGLLEELLL